MEAHDPPHPPQGAGLHTNGLQATSFRLLAEVDPRVSAELLRLLAEQGIAAYSQPSPGATGVYLNRRVPSRPLDSLYVDAAQHDRAKSLADPVVSQHALDAEAQAFEQIVAGLRLEGETGQLTNECSSESVEQADAFDPAAPAMNPSGRVFEPPAVGPRDFGLAPESEHYEPPAPTARAPLHTTTKWAIVSLVFGVLLLISPTLLGIDGGDGTTLVGTIGVLLGVALLITRLRDHDPFDGDDGAVV